MKIKKLFTWLEGHGLDHAAWLAFLARTWSLAERPVTLGLVLVHLSPVGQGYYATFGNVLQVTILIELGLGVVLTQFFSHEAGIAGGREALVSSMLGSRFASVLRMSVAWYAVIAILMVIVIAPIGGSFFAGPGNADLPWKGAWWGYVILSAGMTVVQPFVSALDGMGLIAYMQKIRLGISIAGGVAGWIVLSTGYGLYVLWCLPICHLLVIGYILARKHRYLLNAAASENLSDFSWMRDVWPMQWRIGVSWACGYFIYQLYGPVLFRLHGPEVAGQMGVSMQICNMMTMISGALVTLKSPIFGQLVARREFSQLDLLFFRSARFAMGASAFFSLAMLAAIWWVSEHTTYGIRFLPFWQFGVLLATILLNAVIGVQSVYLRAHKREPFMVLSLIGALIQVAIILVLAPKYSSAGLVLGNLVATVCISLPLATWIFARCRREWHRPGEMSCSVQPAS